MWVLVVFMMNGQMHELPGHFKTQGECEWAGNSMYVNSQVSNFVCTHFTPITIDLNKEEK